jgi:uncharacterized membrane protein
MTTYPGQGPTELGGGEEPSPYTYSNSGSSSGGDGAAAKPWAFAVAASALAGAFFSGLSTSDFINHLDRQVHSIHCSFIPGASAQLGESGCRTVMMSPYSSLFRDSMWGGLPISLLAFAVFAYIVARALSFGLRPSLTKKETKYLLLASLLPVLMSLIYGYISTVKIGTVCKLCAGVYITSALGLVFAAVANAKAAAATDSDIIPAWGAWFGIGVGYVALITMLYMAFAPADKDPAKTCGTLVKREDPSGIVLELGGTRGGTEAIAVLDPLCPACKAFDERLGASGLLDKLKLDGVLFPLDATCNWMVKDSLHPGACAVSEAMLCDKERADDILAWAFKNQDKLIASAKESEKGVRKKIADKFPSVKSCIGSPKAKNKVNKSLRWAVANALPVLTPQLFIGDGRVCDEDTDLGLEFTVTEMIKAKGGR